MSLVYVDGHMVSVAKDDCSKCHGTGIWIEQRYRANTTHVECIVRFCECIKIRIDAGEKP